MQPCRFRGTRYAPRVPEGAREARGCRGGGRLIDKTIIVDFPYGELLTATPATLALSEDAEELDGYRIARCFDHGCGFTVAPPRPNWSKAATFGKATFLKYPRSSLPSSRTSAGTTPRPFGDFEDIVAEVYGENPETNERFIAAVQKQTERRLLP